MIGPAMRKWRKGTALCVLLAACLLLQGCWDEVNLGDISYITGLGVDYKDGKYQIYSQMIQFGVVAKTETPQPETDPTWIGKGEGKSVLLALGNLMKSSQMTLSLEQLKTVIVHERALNRIEDILDGLNRQRASRYTSLLFGTRSAVPDVMSGETFFNQSPMQSVLYSPQQHNQQRSFIQPFSMQLVVQYLKEPCMTTHLPAIAMDNRYWKHDGRPVSTQYIEGVFVFRERQYLHYLSEADSAGLRWLNPSFNRFLLEAVGPQGEATVSIHSSRSRMTSSLVSGEPEFALRVSVSGEVAEVDGDIAMNEIIASVQEKIKKQLLDTYQGGVAGHMDLYNLEHHLYRYRHAEWKRLIARHPWNPAEYKLSVEVEMNLIHSGKLDLKDRT
jgi:spore germination protein KC